MTGGNHWITLVSSIFGLLVIMALPREIVTPFASASVVLAIVLLIAFLLLFEIITVKENTCVVIEKYGRFDRVLTPGVYAINRITENKKIFNWLDGYESHVIPTGIATYDPKPIRVYTQDQIQVDVDLVLTFKIQDIKTAIYKTNNLYLIVRNALETSTVSAASTISIKDMIYSKEAIQKQIHRNMDLHDYGIHIEWIGVQNIKTSGDYQKATESYMLQQREAESKLAIQQAKRKSLYEEQKTNNDLEIQKIEHQMKASEMNSISARDKRKIENESEAHRLVQLKSSGLDPECLSTYFICEAMKKCAESGAKTIFIPENTSLFVRSKLALKE